MDPELFATRGSFPYPGRLRSVRSEPGKPADYDPREIARRWAEIARIGD